MRSLQIADRAGLYVDKFSAISALLSVYAEEVENLEEAMNLLEQGEKMLSTLEIPVQEELRFLASAIELVLAINDIEYADRLFVPFEKRVKDINDVKYRLIYYMLKVNYYLREKDIVKSEEFLKKSEEMLKKYGDEYIKEYHTLFTWWLECLKGSDKKDEYYNKMYKYFEKKGLLYRFERIKKRVDCSN